MEQGHVQCCSQVFGHIIHLGGQKGSQSRGEEARLLGTLSIVMPSSRIFTEYSCEFDSHV